MVDAIIFIYLLLVVSLFSGAKLAFLLRFTNYCILILGFYLD